MAYGIHTATNVSNVLNCLKNNGKTFVGRYFAVTNTWKSLTKIEAQNISSVGLYIVSIWEDGPADKPSYFTYDQGKKDGNNAFHYAADIQQTANTPVYFAVDFDATSSHKQAILDYFVGVRDGYLQYLYERRKYGEEEIYYKIGVYGSYDVLTWCKEQGIATYFFQAYAPAWSNGRNKDPWPGYHLRQLGSNQDLCNIKVDPDESSGAAGGWKY